VHTDPSPTVRNLGFGPTEIVSSTTLVKALTRVRTFFSVLVIHTASPPNATANEPGATSISAPTLFVAGSTRASVPLLSVIIQYEPAPIAMPPSLLPIVDGNVAETLPVFRSIRETVLSPQFGTQRLPNPAASPEHGRAPTVMVSRITFFFG